MRFLKPEQISIVGSWAMGLGIKGSVVDIVVQIPSGCWERDDHLNYNYHRKRALYLARLATHLQGVEELVEDLQFETVNGDLSRPLLLIHPSGKLNQRIVFRLFTSASSEFVAKEKLLPNRCCIAKPSSDVLTGEPTPFYNNSILADMMMIKITEYAKEKLSEMKNILNACLLLRMWLRQRQLQEAFGMFSLTQFVVFLIDNKKLYSNMSVYQILRTVWLQLARSDWSKEGITLQRQDGPASSSVADAHASFPVVFLDSTSTVNFCAHVTKVAYDWLRWECNVAIGLLNKTSVNSFSSLFITPKPFLLAFDNVVIFTDINRSGAKKEVKEPFWFGNEVDKVHKCLAKGLGNRLKLMASKPLPTDPWKIDEEPPKIKNTRLAFGFCYNTPEAWESMDKGPAADSPESEEFRAFWGEKSELRRFQDGFICEAVHWPANNWAQRRLVCRQIITYLMEKRIALKGKFHFIANQLDEFLTIPKLEDVEAYGTGEEAGLSALEALDGLAKNLRNLDDLSLPITQVQGVAASFRHAEPFPHLPQIPKGSFNRYGRAGDNLLPTMEMTPMFIPSLEVLLSLQTSGKWPEDDLEAVRRIKAAFYIELADKLRKHFQLVAQVFVDHIITEHNGFVFKLVIAYKREVALLKRIVEPTGIVKSYDNPESLLLHRQTQIRPKLSAALRGLQAQQPAFSSAVRLAKRWVAAQMLFDFMEEEVIEMIVASLFIDSTMYGQPAIDETASTSTSKCVVDWVGPMSPQVAFLRFLQLVSCFDWNVQALVINFNDGLSAEELKKIELEISTQRVQQPVSLVLVTPYDYSGIAFTRVNPPKPVWSRLMVLAHESLKLLEQQLMSPNQSIVEIGQSFRPPLDVYDAVIHLNRGFIARRLYTLDARATDKKLHPFTKDKRTRKCLPVYDFEPVDCLLKELRTCYGDKCRFFYDKYGGTLIGVMWINKAWNVPSEFLVSHVNASTLVAPSTTGREKRLAPNLEAICQDFLIMGRGLVSTVQCGSLEMKNEA